MSKARPRWSLFLPAVAFLAAGVLRVVPGWQAVYGDGVIDLQGADPYYHLRSIESLLATFPKRSGFDPYALHPGGMDVRTGPFFDYLVAGLALAFGAGNPSPEFIRQTAAWVPPLFGALAVFPVFWLGRVAGGTAAGFVAACWFALCPGHTSFYAKLGFADHHIFETLFYALLLAALAAALDPQRANAGRFAVVAGLALGLALLNRPAAAFLGALIGVWAGLQAGIENSGTAAVRSVIRAALIALLMGWLFLVPAGVGAWGSLPHMAMAGGALAAVGGWLAAEQVRKRNWPIWAWGALLAAALAAVIGVGWIASPHSLDIVWRGFTNAITGGEGRLVAEVRSPLRHANRWTLRPLLAELGPVGVMALPLLAAMAFAGFRERNRALSLVAGTGLLVYLATLLQARMAIYASVNLAVAAGWVWSELMDAQTLRQRLVRGAAMALLAFAYSAVGSWAASGQDMGMTPQWRQAMEWLRTRTPDPLGDPEAYSRYYPRVSDAPRPAAAYGVLVWWDLGYWALAEGRRAPIANGTQAGASKVAAYYTSNDAAAAAASLDELDARYVVADNTLPMVQIRSLDDQAGEIYAMTQWAGKDPDELLGVYELPLDGGGGQPVLIFYPRYFQTMAVRLYLHDGAAYEPHNATTVFSLRKGKGRFKLISSRRTFASYDEAQRYMDARKDQDLVLGTMDPLKSCVPLEPLNGLRKVFDSGPEELVSQDGLLRAVKIFERLPETEPAASPSGE